MGFNSGFKGLIMENFRGNNNLNENPAIVYDWSWLAVCLMKVFIILEFLAREMAT